MKSSEEIQDRIDEIDSELSEVDQDSPAFNQLLGERDALCWAMEKSTVSLSLFGLIKLNTTDSPELIFLCGATVAALYFILLLCVVR